MSVKKSKLKPDFVTLMDGIVLNFLRDDGEKLHAVVAQIKSSNTIIRTYTAEQWRNILSNYTEKSDETKDIGKLIERLKNLDENLSKNEIDKIVAFGLCKLAESMATR